MITADVQTPTSVGVSVSPDDIDIVLQAIANEDVSAEDMAQAFCQSCIEGSDRQRWRFGAVVDALKQRARYGDTAVNEIARISGIGRSTAHQYGAMYKFYPVEIQHRYDGSNIKWTAMKHAMRLGKLEKAIEYLDEAQDAGKTTDQIAVETAKKKPSTTLLLECTGRLKYALLASDSPKPGETSMLHLEIPATADIQQVQRLIHWQKDSGKYRKVQIKLHVEVIDDARE
jgi:hypothetical protein